MSQVQTSMEPKKGEEDRDAEEKQEEGQGTEDVEL